MPSFFLGDKGHVKRMGVLFYIFIGVKKQLWYRLGCSVGTFAIPLGYLLEALFKIPNECPVLMATWLFRATWLSFTTCLSSRGKLTVAFVCCRTVRMAAIYQLKIKYDQDKFGVFFFRCKTPGKLEDKQAVNEHRVARKSHDVTQKKMPSPGAFQSTTRLVWNKLAVSKTLF